MLEAKMRKWVGRDRRARRPASTMPATVAKFQRELVAANQRLGRQRPRIVVGSHHKPVRAGAHNREQIALMQLRHFPIQRKEITRLAYGPDNVDLFNPLPLSLTLTRTRLPALTLAHSFTLTWRFASACRD